MIPSTISCRGAGRRERRSGSLKGTWPPRAHVRFLPSGWRSGTICTDMAIPRLKDKRGAREFGAFVHRLREAKALKVREFARRTGIPHTTWSRGERGLVDLRKWDYLVPLAQTLSIPLFELAKKAGWEEDSISRVLQESPRSPAQPTVQDKFARFGAIEVEGVTAKRHRGMAARAGIAQVGVVVRATASLLEDLGPDVGEFGRAMSAVLQESHRRGDPSFLREVTAYAKGLLARGESKRSRARED